VPAYAASGKGEHQYLHVQKRLLTTPDLLKRVTRAVGVPERDIGFAGMKDKHAVTTQWLSVQSKTALTTELDLGPEAKVL
jgi:tRNA pseudouridine13 synthase